MTVALDDIKAAAEALRGRAVDTPCLPSPRLSERAGCALTFKFENFQLTSSFKDRGACVKLLSLDADQRRRGVVAMSAGNHAQGVAHHAARLGIPATIVMPRLTPAVKVEKTRQLGARVELEGETLEDSAAHARMLEQRDDLTFIHPYDDPQIIAGQGTIGLEMLQAAPDLEVLVVPIGGGGLMAGVATAAKALKPEIRMIGVQAAANPAMYRRRLGLPDVAPGPTIAEGIAVKVPGRLTTPIIDALVEDILLVEEIALEDAILQLLEIERTVIEGAGAAGLAAVLSYTERFAGRRVGVVLCGGNIDLRLLSAVILRGLVRSRRLIRLRIGIPDVPGSLAKVAAMIGEAGGNIVEVDHQRAFSPLSVKATEIDVIIETRSAAHAGEIVTRLKAAGFEAASLDGTRFGS
ncbi:MAG TPA: threonine ammonia-lyase [Geminicoccaceae bacterium]